MAKKSTSWQRVFHIISLLLMIVLCSCSDSETGPDKSESLLRFSTPTTIKAAIHGGTADIVITGSGGTMPYEFYVIPETQWNAGDLMYDMLTRNDSSRLYRYTYSRRLFGTQVFVLEVQPGTTTVPRYYWVSVQDKAESGIISGTNMLSWWKRVAAYDL